MRFLPLLVEQDFPEPLRIVRNICQLGISLSHGVAHTVIA